MYSDISTPNETKHTQYIPLVEEGMEVFSTLVLDTKTRVDCSSKKFEGVLKVEEVVKVKEDFAENVTLCVKARDKIIEENVVNEGWLDLESVSSSVGRKAACKILEQHDVMKGEERIDSLWEIYALLDTYQSDSTTKSAQKAAVVFEKKKTKRTRKHDYYGNEDDDVQMQTGHKSAQKAAVVFEKKKNKRTRKLDYYGNEDDDVQMQTRHPGCLPFKLCARKMNLRMGRTQILKITKALKGIDLLPLHHHHVMKRRSWQKKQILI